VTPALETPAPQNTQPPALNEIRVVGDNGDPGSAFPLGECEGDCDVSLNILSKERSGDSNNPAEFLISFP
jgi:hypothetical protein